jgi:ribosome modulation factor
MTVEQIYHMLGYESYCDGKKIHDCPYEKDSIEEINWLRGWSQAYENFEC